MAAAADSGCSLPTMRRPCRRASPLYRRDADHAADRRRPLRPRAAASGVKRRIAAAAACRISRRSTRDRRGARSGAGRFPPRVGRRLVEVNIGAVVATSEAAEPFICSRAAWKRGWPRSSFATTSAAKRRKRRRPLWTASARERNNRDNRKKWGAVMKRSEINAAIERAKAGLREHRNSPAAVRLVDARRLARQGRRVRRNPRLQARLGRH